MKKILIGFLSVLLTMAAAFSCFFFTGFFKNENSQTQIVEDSNPIQVSERLDGEGTKENPWKISSAADFFCMAKMENEKSFANEVSTKSDLNGDLGGQKQVSGEYELTSSITLSNWFPIGTFSGNLNGNGYSVDLGSLMVITGYKTSDETSTNYDIMNESPNNLFIIDDNKDERCVGLFANYCSETASITDITFKGNLNFKNYYSSDADYVGDYSSFVPIKMGGVVGKSKATMKSIISEVNINMYLDFNHLAPGFILGGVVGEYEGDSGKIFENIDYKGTIHSDGIFGFFPQIIGGVVGRLQSVINSTYLYFEGKIDWNTISVFLYIGGIAGQMGGGTLRKSCSNGYISCKAPYAIGGVVAALIDNQGLMTQINSCVNFSTFYFDSLGKCFGGIVGLADEASTVYIQECANFSDLITFNDYSGCMGGIIGKILAQEKLKNVNIYYCVNYGDINISCSDNNKEKLYVGGICGYIDLEGATKEECLMDIRDCIVTGTLRGYYTCGITYVGSTNWNTWFGSVIEKISIERCLTSECNGIESSGLVFAQGGIAELNEETMNVNDCFGIIDAVHSYGIIDNSGKFEGKYKKVASNVMEDYFKTLSCFDKPSSLFKSGALADGYVAPVDLIQEVTPKIMWYKPTDKNILHDADLIVDKSQIFLSSSNRLILGGKYGDNVPAANKRLTNIDISFNIINGEATTFKFDFRKCTFVEKNYRNVICNGNSEKNFSIKNFTNYNIIKEFSIEDFIYSITEYEVAFIFESQQVYLNAIYQIDGGNKNIGDDFLGEILNLNYIQHDGGKQEIISKTPNKSYYYLDNITFDLVPNFGYYVKEILLETKIIDGEEIKKELTSVTYEKGHARDHDKDHDNKFIFRFENEIFVIFEKIDYTLYTSFNEGETLNYIGKDFSVYDHSFDDSRFNDASYDIINLSANLGFDYEISWSSSGKKGTYSKYETFSEVEEIQIIFDDSMKEDSLVISIQNSYVYNGDKFNEEILTTDTIYISIKQIEKEFVIYTHDMLNTFLNEDYYRENTNKDIYGIPKLTLNNNESENKEYKYKSSEEVILDINKQYGYDIIQYKGNSLVYITFESSNYIPDLDKDDSLPNSIVIANEMKNTSQIIIENIYAKYVKYLNGLSMSYDDNPLIINIYIYYQVQEYNLNIENNNNCKEIVKIINDDNKDEYIVYPTDNNYKLKYYAHINLSFTSESGYKFVGYFTGDNLISINDTYDFTNDPVKLKNLYNKLSVSIKFDNYTVNNNGPEIRNNIINVSKPEHLVWISLNNSSYNGFKNYKINQTSNIDLTGIKLLPIGDEKNAFKGIYNGNSYIISNLTLVGGDYIENLNYMGLFGYVDGATIQNLTLKNGSVSGYSNVGSIAGYAVDSTFQKVNNYNVAISITKNITFYEIFGSEISSSENKDIGLTQRNNFGGLVGYVSGNSYFYLCSNRGDNKIDNKIIKSHQVGGFIGGTPVSNKVVIEQCFSESSNFVSFAGEDVLESVTFFDCYNNNDNLGENNEDNWIDNPNVNGARKKVLKGFYW